VSLLRLPVVLAITVMPANASPSGDALNMLRGVANDLSTGQFEHAYQRLHPAQRAAFTQGQFVDCYQSAIPSGATLKIGDLKKSRRVSVSIPGTDVTESGYALTVEVDARVNGRSDSSTTTYRAVKTGKRWTWIVDAEHTRGILEGNC
jgi:hypothetical protein